MIDRINLATRDLVLESTGFPKVLNARRPILLTSGARRSSRRENVEAKMVIRPESHFFLPGEHLDVKVGRYLFRVNVGEIASGRIHLTAMALTGEKKQVDKFLEAVSARPDPAKAGSKLLTAPKKVAA